MTYLIAALAAALGICGVLAYRIEAKRLPTKQVRLKDRENLSVEEIYQRYFAESNLPRVQVIELWTKIAELLHLDAGRLRPTDRFDAELAPVKGHRVEDELIDLEELVRFTYKDRWPIVKETKPRNLGELVQKLLA